MAHFENVDFASHETYKHAEQIKGHDNDAEILNDDCHFIGLVGIQIQSQIVPGLNRP